MERSKVDAFVERDAPDDRASSLLTAVVVSDVMLVREGLSAQLARRADLCILASAAPDTDGARLLHECSPAIVIIDFGSRHARQFITRLRNDGLCSRFVGIAIGKSKISPAEWAAAGIAGFVDDDGTIDDVAAAALQVASGAFPCSARTTAALVSGLIARPVPRAMPAVAEICERLTPRETEILFALERGDSNKEIARNLGISAATVKNHVHHLLDKLDVHRRSQAAALLRPAAPQGH